MQRSITIRIARTIAVLLLVGAPLYATAQSARTAITVSAVAPTDTLPFYYAIQQGLFEKAGLDLTVIPSTSGATSILAVSGGAAQFGYGNAVSVTQAFLKGLPIQISFPGGAYDTNAPNAQIAVASDSSLRAAKELEGKTMSVTGLHDLLSLGARAWLDKNGVDYTNVKFVEVAPASMAAALTQKRIDAAVMYEPFLSAALATGTVRTIGKPYDAIAPHFMPSVWFGNTTWMTEHRDATVRFAQVMFQAQAYTNAHYEELIPLIADFSKLTPDVLRKTPVVKVFPSLQPPMLQPLLDTAVKYKELSRPVRAQELFFPGLP
jgi:NitT/TauT family transport system substrate-binding protein